MPTATLFRAYLQLLTKRNHPNNESENHKSNKKPNIAHSTNMCTGILTFYACGHSNPAFNLCSSATLNPTTGVATTCGRVIYAPGCQTITGKCPSPVCIWVEGQSWECCLCSYDANTHAFCLGKVQIPDTQSDTDFIPSQTCSHQQCLSCPLAQPLDYEQPE